MAVLGISTNTRLVSVAIIAQDELREYFTHLHKSSWSPIKRDAIISSLEPCVRQYCITSVVLSIPYAYHQTPAYQSLVEALKSFCEAHALTLTTYTPEAFNAFSPPGTKKRKKAMMQAMAERFPELRSQYLKEMRNRNKYYYKLFEAVAVAVLATDTQYS